MKNHELDEMPEREVCKHVQRIFSCVSRAHVKTPPQVDASIVKSWARSLQQYRINPGRLNPVQVLTTAELREYTEPIERFLRIAKIGVQRLHRQVAELGYSTLLCDTNGVTVDWRGDDRFHRQWMDAGLYLGSVWSEHQEGTCGVGTTLIEMAPMIIHKGEHFRAKNANLTCSCAPIIGPNGVPLGVLDVSALHSKDSKESQHLALQLVMQSAHMIESAYFLTHFEDQWVLRLSFERELAEVSSDCLIAMDGEGRVLAADRIASDVLRREVAGDCLVGRYISEIFEVNVEKLLGIFAKTGIVLPIRSQWAGVQMFASLRCPQAIAIKSIEQSAKAPSRQRSLPKSDESLTIDYLVGEDQKLLESLSRIKRVMNKPTSILLNGETGTGKEAFARAIHTASQRADKPFVAVNCAAIPESLIESELFGCKAGVFAGARNKGMRGKVLQSDGGTLFFDEIGDIPASLQSSLLRVLVERVFLPPSGDTPIPVDLHVICATHRNIPGMVACGEFSEDLYDCLRGVSFELPSLRKRSDIECLIKDMLIIEAGSGVEKITIEDEAMRILLGFSWPGNIRQLRNVLRYALAVCEKNIVTCVDLPNDLFVRQEPMR